MSNRLPMRSRGLANFSARRRGSHLARLTAGLNDREAAELSDVPTRARHLLGAARAPERRELP
ncbi:hypothetical protein C7I87_09225 [Mesorhizobium sp. SARCC-RB16n]|nr:hypothetical protein C7I87_09225 [Mesorhizobium sp. SARCC-RB16n]